MGWRTISGLRRRDRTVIKLALEELGLDLERERPSAEHLVSVADLARVLERAYELGRQESLGPTELASRSRPVGQA
jgi:hypothetical protein